MLDIILEEHVLKGAHDSILLWHRNLLSQDIPFQDFDWFQIRVGYSPPRNEKILQDNFRFQISDLGGPVYPHLSEMKDAYMDDIDLNFRFGYLENWKPMDSCDRIIIDNRRMKNFCQEITTLCFCAISSFRRHL